MKKRNIFIALLVLVTLLPAATQALTATETLVAERCTSIKTILDAQRRRDLVSRINRGRAYQTVIDQLQALNDRVRNNQMNVVPFEQQQSALRDNVEAFRRTYTAYDDALSALLQINCTEKPAEFLQQLAKVRQLRGDVGQQVTVIEQTLGRYREIITNLQAEIERLRNAVLGNQLP